MSARWGIRWAGVAMISAAVTPGAWAQTPSASPPATAPTAQPQPRPTMTASPRPAASPPYGAAPQVRMRWQDFVSGPAGAQRLASLRAAVTKIGAIELRSVNAPDQP